MFTRMFNWCFCMKTFSWFQKVHFVILLHVWVTEKVPFQEQWVFAIVFVVIHHYSDEFKHHSSNDYRRENRFHGTESRSSACHIAMIIIVFLMTMAAHSIYVSAHASMALVWRPFWLANIKNWTSTNLPDTNLKWPNTTPIRFFKQVLTCI